MRVPLIALCCTATALALAGCSGTEAEVESTPTPVASETSDETAVEATATNAIVLSYKVEGMDCGGCEQSVVDAVKGIEGVTACSASHEADTASVEVADASIAQQITDAITDAGYPATLQDG